MSLRCFVRMRDSTGQVTGKADSDSRIGEND